WSHPYGYTPFVFDVTRYLASGGDNVLAVRVRNEGQNSRWYSGSGIYRHVWLTITSELRIPLWGVGGTTPRVTPEQSAVEISVALENRGKVQQNAIVKTRIVAADGRAAGAAQSSVNISAGDKVSTTQTIDISAPKLWSSQLPHLYRAEMEVE